MATQKLHAIILIDCDLILNDPPPTLKIEKVHFGPTSSKLDSRDNWGKYSWLDILCPHAIRELTLEFPDVWPGNLRSIITSATGPCLKYNNAIFSTQLAQIISHPTALESLTILPFIYYPHRSGNYLDFRVPLPSLRKYEGIYGVMEQQCFELSENVQSLTLTDNFKMRYGHHNTLVANQLRGVLPHAHALRELCVAVAVLSTNLLRTITSEYPNIRVLSISVGNLGNEVSQSLIVICT